MLGFLDAAMGLYSPRIAQSVFRRTSRPYPLYTMKAWKLDKLGGHLRLEDVPIPEPRPGGVVVKVEASSLMTYMKPYVEGRLPVYNAPKGEITPGGNGVGIVSAVGKDVWHFKPGQRVIISSHIT